MEPSLKTPISLYRERTFQKPTRAWHHVRTRMRLILPLSRTLHLVRPHRSLNAPTEYSAKPGIPRGGALSLSQVTSESLVGFQNQRWLRGGEGGGKRVEQVPSSQAQSKGFIGMFSFLLSSMNTDVPQRGVQKRNLDCCPQIQWPFQLCLIGRP